MITVYYRYLTKSGEWKSGEKEVNNPETAVRFIYSINSPKLNSYVTGYSCDDPEDNEYISKRVYLRGK